MSRIPWLRAGIASKWDNQCLTCPHLRGLCVTCVGGICWYTIINFQHNRMFPGWFLGSPSRQRQGNTSMLLPQRAQNRTLRTCQTFVCVLSQYPKRKDEQRESCLLPFVARGWQAARGPFNCLLGCSCLARVKRCQLYAALPVTVM